jgi:uncharacterized protein
MNLYDATIPIFVKMLTNAEGWLSKAAALAAQKKFEPDIFMQMRLAPDMYPFARQIQAACDTAKFAAAKMTGKEAPSHPDTEKTLEELRARVRTCVSYLETFSRQDFVGCEDRRCSHQWMGAKSMRVGDYLDHFVLPNFHFHMTVAYGILRHNGVEVGKMSYLGNLPMSE